MILDVPPNVSGAAIPSHRVPAMPFMFDPVWFDEFYAHPCPISFHGNSLIPC